ncbi:MAG: hypothetical protein GC165_09870 [Armatimonadetes bacterium]|nr:hypothetical protein [Armatimonadota bacterium]MBS1728559.1 DIP1984 family protein [Armatimonadota bacterium]
MKLAEALIERSDVQKRLLQLGERLKASAKVQEGNEPPENPDELLNELDHLAARFEHLVLTVNLTNAKSVVEGKTLTEHLAVREALAKKIAVLRALIADASPNMTRMTRSELRTLSTVDIGNLRSQVDDLSKRHREVDTLIQGSNWVIDLVE